MLKHSLEIQSIATALSEHETQSGLLCPDCDGGNNKERSFSVTRNGSAILFKCHRASCSFSGAISNSYLKLSVDGAKKEPKGVPVFDLTTLPEERYNFLKKKFNLNDTCMDILEAKWCEEEKRYYLPIFAPDGVEVGFNFRSWEPGVANKAKIFLTQTDRPALAVYGSGKGQAPLVIVEDQISAAKGYDVTNIAFAALLSTHCDPHKAVSIKKHLNPSIVVFALDKDATQLSYKYYQQFRGLFPRIKIMELDKDVKDMTQEAIWKEIRAIVYDEEIKEKLIDT